MKLRTMLSVQPVRDKCSSWIQSINHLVGIALLGGGKYNNFKAPRYDLKKDLSEWSEVYASDTKVVKLYQHVRHSWGSQGR
mmetsp:Transcript_12188/g.23034  ORF Transcript_12188/g.23034 Transcript_12188/m.23034 type:complete len:81 (+) Transcript_12188:436-678(+)